MITPTRTEILDHVSAHFGIPRKQVLEIFRTPTHPATMLDDFAMFAMQGLLARGFPGITPESVAKDAYDMAEAMMRERKEPQ